MAKAVVSVVDACAIETSTAETETQPAQLDNGDAGVLTEAQPAMDSDEVVVSDPYADALDADSQQWSTEDLQAELAARF